MLSSVFSLPSKSTLCLWMQSFKISAGFSDDLINATACRVKALSERDRVCVLMIDEMSIKRFLSYDRLCDTVIGYDDCGFERKNLEATNALVFMIRGLAANYKQPIGYVFSHSCCSGELLLTLLYRALDILGEIGLKVKAIISDQGSNFVKLTTDLGVSATCPTFTHNSKTYHCIF